MHFSNFRSTCCWRRETRRRSTADARRVAASVALKPVVATVELGEDSSTCEDDDSVADEFSVTDHIVKAGEDVSPLDDAGRLLWLPSLRLPTTTMSTVPISTRPTVWTLMMMLGMLLQTTPLSMVPSMPKAAPANVGLSFSIDSDASDVGSVASVDAAPSLEVGEELCCVATASPSVGAPTLAPSDVLESPNVSVSLSATAQVSRRKAPDRLVAMSVPALSPPRSFLVSIDHILSVQT